MTDGLLRSWLDPAPTSAPEELRAALGGHPLTADILYRRGLRDAEAARAFLDPNRYTPAPPEALPGVEAACARLEQAIAHREKICVWGDFDVDGQTSTALLVEGLRTLGAEVVYHIPVRASESHGVNITHLKPILEAGARLVLTCDTGISAGEALDFARRSGADVIITDHHELPEDGPPAGCMVVSPRLLPEGHALAGLPGVGVAYKLLEALFARAKRQSESALFLDLVALGIVADLAVQTGDTRYLLQRGLEMLRQARRAGLQAMIDLTGLHAPWLTEEHIGFVLGPRLNALGRLGDANPAVELLTTRDAARARVLATHLEGLNAQRRHLSEQVLQGALAQIKKDRSLLDFPALVLSHPDWPAGVIGIVASELVERYNRPTVLLAAPPGQPARGSARSVAGVNITAAIATQAQLLLGFGGHPMAAGLSLEAANIPAFRRGLGRAVDAALGGQAPARPTLTLDGEVRLSDLTLDLAADLERLAPFGPGNPPLALLARGLRIQNAAPIGKSGDHLHIIAADDNGETRRVIWWGGAGWPLPEGQLDLACSIRASNYRGQRDVQIEWIDARPAESAAIELRSRYEIIDRRAQPHPLAVLTQLRAAGTDLIVWGEAEAREVPGAVERARLAPASTLVIWTTPPGRRELLAALEAVKPSKVVVLAVDPRDASLEAFLRRLAGLCKYALNAMGGETSLLSLAAATAQRETTVRLGLRWLEQRGILQVDWLEDGRLRLLAGGQPSPAVEATLKAVQAALDETAAYRAFFQSTSVEGLL